MTGLGLLHWRQALQEVHRPTSIELMRQAVTRLAFQVSQPCQMHPPSVCCVARWKADPTGSCWGDTHAALSMVLT
jgi:hypothetical protein